MKSLLNETKGYLEENGKTLDDIVWWGTVQTRSTVPLRTILDVKYDSGYGTNEIPMSFILVGKDFWLERHEYDGSEWWEFKRYPQPPIEAKEFVLADLSYY